MQPLPGWVDLWVFRTAPAEESGWRMDILAPAPVAYVTAAIAMLVFARHHENIQRLLAGTEPRIGAATKG